MKGKKDKGLMVTLEVGEKKEDFDFEHAQAILRIESKRNPRKVDQDQVWRLPADSKYTFANGNIIDKSNNGTDKEAQKRG